MAAATEFPVTPSWDARGGGKESLSNTRLFYWGETEWCNQKEEGEDHTVPATILVIRLELQA